MQLLLAFAAAALGLGVAAAAPSRPAGFNDAGNDPRAIMRGAGNYHHTLKAHGIKAGRGYERLKPLHAGHKHLPHVHDFFNFTGTTDGGFLDMRHNAIVRNTTINADDYLELLTAPGVAFACAAVGAAPAFAPLPAGTAPHYDADHKLVRNNVQLTLTLPAALGAAGAATAPALEHLRARLAAAAGEHTSLAFGFELMATQAAFASGADCAAQVPYATPYFAVALASGPDDAAASTWTLTLTPATPMDLFLSMDTTINFDPNVQRAHSRRLGAGLHLGADVRSSDAARRLWSATLSSSNGVNWNGQTGASAAASTATIDMLPSVGAGVLACKNCYAYYSVSFSVSFKFCVTYYAAGYGNIARDTTNNPVSSTVYTPQTFPDCASLGTQQANVAYNDYSSVNFNFGLSTSAKFTGQAGLNIQVTSVGFSGKKVVPQFNMFNTGSLAAMSFGSLLPVSIVPLLGLDASANITASLPPFSMGASASVQVDLGGSISLPSMWTGTSTNYVSHAPTISTFHSLDSTFTSQPFTIDQAAASSGNAWGGSATISLIPWYKLNLFSILPITAAPVYTVGAKMWTQGALPPSRLLREGGGRQLSGCVDATANANAGLGISVGATTVTDIVPAISSTLASFVPSGFGSIPVTTAATLYSVPTIGGPFSIATPPCPSASPSPSVSPSVSPAAALAAAAGSSSGASSSSGLPLGAIIGGAVGAAVVVALIAGAAYYAISKKSAATVKAAAAADAKEGAATSSTNPGLVVRAIAAT